MAARARQTEVGVIVRGRPLLRFSEQMACTLALAWSEFSQEQLAKMIRLLLIL